MSRTYTAPCIYCGNMITTPRKPPKQGIGCGRGECTQKHNAAVEAERKKIRAQQRRHAPTQYVMSELGMAFMLGRRPRTSATDEN